MEILLRVFEREDYWLFDPEDVTEYGEYVLRMPDHDGDPLFAYAHKETIAGPFGYYPYAALAHGQLPTGVSWQGQLLEIVALIALGATLYIGSLAIFWIAARMPDGPEKEIMQTLKHMGNRLAQPSQQ